MEEVAQRYAESLFSLAKDEGKVEKYAKDMQLIGVVLDDKKMINFFSHVSVKNEDKINILKQSFENKVDSYVLNFLFLLVKKRRIKHIQLICKEFNRLCNDYLGIVSGKVYTAFKLTDDQLKAIEEAMGKKEGKKVLLNEVIDKTLIGGIKVEINNHIYDDSLSYKLESLRKELLRE